MDPRCELCPAKHNIVPSDGPEREGYISVILEAPGPDENKKGHPLIGKTGREANEGYFPLAGLRRCDLRVGNAISCFPETGNHKLDINDPKQRALAECCAKHHLFPELERLQPKLLILCGTFACHVIDPTIDLELHHGIPLETKWGMVFPMYHPAMGMHSPKTMLHIRTDWIRLRRLLRGQLCLPYDEYEGHEDYATIGAPWEVDEDMNEILYSQPLACDTESTPGKKPFCLTYSTIAGRGRLIKADDYLSLDRFQYHLSRWEGPVLFHNWLWDEVIVKRMGMKFNGVIDTMMRAFHLGNLPQGLKALSYRELGMAMKDFDDVVKPHSTKVCLEYIRDAYTRDWPKPPQQEVRNDDGTTRMYQPQSMKSKFKRMLTDYKKNPDTDVFKRWEKWKDSHLQIEFECGPFPGKSIEHAWEADRETTVRYACRDADALLRLWPVLRHMERRVRRAPQESWRD